jgi:hypothetical protein
VVPCGSEPGKMRNVPLSQSRPRRNLYHVRTTAILGKGDMGGSVEPEVSIQKAEPLPVPQMPSRNYRRFAQQQFR